MNTDAELDLWRREWQSEETVPLHIRDRVKKQTRRMKFGIAADVLVTIAMGGGFSAFAVRSPQSDNILLAIIVWLFLAAAWSFGLITNRGNWSPLTLNTAGFVDLSIRRCRSRLATVRFALGLVLVEAAFCLVWIYRHSPQRPPVLMWLLFSSLQIDMVWLMTATFLVCLLWYGRKKRAELTYWLRFEAESVDPISHFGSSA